MKNYTVDRNFLQLVLITLFVFILMSVLNPGKFLTMRNFTSMSFQFPELGLLTFAIMISLISEGIDLSVVSMANLSGIVAALLLTKAIPENSTTTQVVLLTITAIFLAMSTGVLCGYINGLLITVVEITPILTTLGTMQLYMGIAFVITKGTAVFSYPESFLTIGNGMIYFVPNPLIIFIAVVIIMAIVLNRTRFGLNLYMLGTNETAAKFSGISVKKTLAKTYMLSGLLSAITGVLMIARTNSAKADYGSSYLLQAVLVSILGGVSPSGGFGKVLGVVIAVLSLQFLSSGINMLRFSNFAKEFTWGMLLLIVMVINYCGKKNKR